MGNQLLLVIRMSSITSNLPHILHRNTMSTVQMQHLGLPTGNLHLTTPQAPCVPLHGFPKAGFGPQGLLAGRAS